MENEYGLDKNGVRELNINDFDIERAKCITNNDKSGALVFYQAWCPHCRTIVDDVASANKSLGNKHIILAVHGQTPRNNEIFERFGIMGIPSIKFMKKDGSVTSNFEGKRTANNLIEFIQVNSAEDDSKLEKKEKKEKKEKINMKKKIKIDTKEKINMKDKMIEMTEEIMVVIKQKEEVENGHIEEVRRTIVKGMIIKENKVHHRAEPTETVLIQEVKEPPEEIMTNSLMHQLEEAGPKGSTVENIRTIEVEIESMKMTVVIKEIETKDIEETREMVITETETRDTGEMKETVVHTSGSEKNLPKIIVKVEVEEDGAHSPSTKQKEKKIAQNIIHLRKARNAGNEENV